MIKLTRGKGVWIWVGGAVLLVVIVFFSTEAFSASMSVTAQTLQNTGPNGVITYSSNYSAAAAVITRHESSDITLNVSDQITTVTVQGTKLSGAADTQVDLLDASATILDTATVALPTTAGVYNTPVTLTSGTTLYFSVAKVLAVYTASAAPVVISLAAIGDAQLSQQNATTTYGTSSTLFVRTRGVAKNKRTIVQFDVSSIPVGATVSSATLTLCAISPPSPARTYDVHRAHGHLGGGDSILGLDANHGRNRHLQHGNPGHPRMYVLDCHGGCADLG